MNREFIPYEQALELKELGFDEECLGNYVPYFSKEGWRLNLDIERMNVTNSLLQQGFSAPTFSQAFRFFREKYNLHFSIGTTNICVYHIPVSNYHTSGMIQGSKTYDEAMLQCLKKFIETVKHNPHLWQNL